MTNEGTDTSKDDDARAKFRAALEKKTARTGGSSPREPGKTVTPQDNTKRQKTFRRKSGG